MTDRVALGFEGIPKVGQVWTVHSSLRECVGLCWTYQIVAVIDHPVSGRWYVGVKLNPDEPNALVFDAEGWGADRAYRLVRPSRRKKPLF